MSSRLAWANDTLSQKFLSALTPQTTVLLSTYWDRKWFVSPFQRWLAHHVLIKKKNQTKPFSPVVVAQVFNPSTWKAEAG